MFDYKHYVPILKGKQSEFLALEQVSSTRKAHITPLIEIQELEGELSLDRLSRRIRKSWNSEVPIFIDVDNNFLVNSPRNANSALDYIINDTRKRGYRTIPVTGLDRDVTYQQNINLLVRKIGEVCIRLKNSDIGNISKMIENLNELVKLLGLEYKQIDIIIDIGSFLHYQMGTFTNAVINTINNLPSLNNWRTLTVIGTSFPYSLSRFRPVTPCFTPRSEYALWQNLLTIQTIKRLPSFGDYTVVHPVMPEIDFQLVPIDAKIKYATESDWLILRWHHGRQYSWDRFYDLCDILVRHPAYSGPNFCWADNKLSLCALRNTSSGNPAMWVRIGINRHLSFVADQVANYALP